MNINLKEIPIFCFSGKNEERKNKIRSVIKKLDLEQNTQYVDCIISNIPQNGTRQTYVKILENCININSPCLVLEDDVNFLFNYNQNLSAPENADAVYLGTSGSFLTTEWMDRSPTKEIMFNGQIQAEEVESFGHLYKIKNMLSAHAILFISKEYKEICYNVLKYNMNLKFHPDCLLAELMNYYNVYAYKKPMFYQDCYKDNPYAYFLTFIPLDDFIDGRVRKDKLDNSIRELFNG